MRTMILCSAALLALAGCGQTATPNATTANAAETDTDGPDITEVPDESADANSGGEDADDGNDTDDNASANGAAAN